MLESLGNIGDFVGGVGVVVTLVYLSVQVRQNSRSVRSASAQAMLASLNQLNATIGATDQSAGVFMRGQLSPDSLDENEAAQFAHQILGWFRVMEQAFYEHQLGGLDPEIWKGYVAQMHSFMQAPGVDRWWAVRAPVFHPEFREFIRNLQNNESVPGGAAALEAILGRTPPAA